MVGVGYMTAAQAKQDIIVLWKLLMDLDYKQIPVGSRIYYSYATRKNNRKPNIYIVKYHIRDDISVDHLLHDIIVSDSQEQWLKDLQGCLTEEMTADIRGGAQHYWELIVVLFKKYPSGLSIS